MKIDANSTILLKAIYPIAIIVVMFVLLFNIGFSKITDLRTTLASSTKDRDVLTVKLNSLDKVDASISDKADITVFALPQSNPALVVSTQLKILAQENLILIKSIKAGAELKDKTNLSRAELNLELEGPKEGILNFMAMVKTLSPIGIISKFKVTESSSLAHAEVTINSYWSVLPEKLPNITDANKSSLTAEEMKILDQISLLRAPVFGELTPSAEVSGSDPFLSSSIFIPESTPVSIATPLAEGEEVSLEATATPVASQTPLPETGL